MMQMKKMEIRNERYQSRNADQESAKLFYLGVLRNDQLVQPFIVMRPDREHS
jgi:hypothetical protein